MKKLKLEIGKEYVTRSGLKVKVYDIAESGTFPVIAGMFPVIAGVLKNNTIYPAAYTKKGRRLFIETDDYDIVGEWQEPLDFDWSCLPKWANRYIAMDSSGVWCFHEFKPTLKDGYWLSEPDSCFYTIPDEYAPKNFKGTWGNSLFKNPNINN